MHYRGLYWLVCVLVLAAVVTAATAEDEDIVEQEAIESYIGFVSGKLKGFIYYPWDAMQGGLSGLVVLRLTLRWDGHVVSSQVVESQGDESFRIAALDAVRRVGQMPPFPATIQRHTLLVELPINFRLGDQSHSTSNSIEIGASDPRYAESEKLVRSEGWMCYAGNDENKIKPAITLIYAKNNRGEEFALVQAAGAEHPASFKVAGIHRRWDFGYDESEGSYLYAFIIKTDGTGLYYDFSFRGRARASDVFACEIIPD